MGKILALDLGDQWVGLALSDLTKMFARPYKTVPAQELEEQLISILQQESIDTIVVGYPRTMRGTESEQTRKVKATYTLLTERFSSYQFVLWDERLSSKRVQKKGRETKEEKLKSHAIAAAFILDSYLTFLSSQNQEQDKKNY